MSVICGRSVFSRGTSVSSTNKTDRHDITEILLKVALNTINLTPLLCTMFKQTYRSTNTLMYFVLCKGSEVSSVLCWKKLTWVSIISHEYQSSHMSINNLMYFVLCRINHRDSKCCNNRLYNLPTIDVRLYLFLVHLVERVMWAIVITLYLLSVNF